MSPKWRKRLRFMGLMLALCALGVVATLMLGRLITAFYSYVPKQYEPKDQAREKTLPQEKTDQNGKR